MDTGELESIVDILIIVLASKVVTLREAHYKPILNPI
jgi:hypothetical protein